MFEGQIAQGRDMIQRLESESKLSEMERNALPFHRRVPRKEAVAWQEMIEKKIQSAFDPDTFARYDTAWVLYREELDRGQGDEYSRALNAWKRIVAFLDELDSRAPTSPGQSIGRPDMSDEE